MIKKRSDPLVIGKVIGEVVDSFSPTAKMSVIYNSKNHVYNGHHLLPSTLISKPKVLLHAAGDFTTFFTLVNISCLQLFQKLGKNNFKKGNFRV